MNEGVRFRKNCKECGRVFFSTRREGNFCPRCVKQVSEREEQARKLKEKKGPGKRETSKIAGRDGFLPQTLTEELKERIGQEFEFFRAQKDLTRRKIHGLIGKKMGIPKKLVAQALQAAEDNIPLGPEQEKEIISRYCAYVERLERPPKGRRKTIAVELGLPYRRVAVTIQEWKRKQPPLKSLTREQRFAIEKNYFRFLDEGKSLSQIQRKLVKDSGYSLWQVSRYLDLLHDGEDRLKKVMDVTPEQSETILLGYQQYLFAPDPPEPFLHTLLAERAGVDYRQVHKVLLVYRLGRLRDLQAKT